MSADPTDLANERMLTQKKTFTRWTNHFLSERMLKVEDIFKDFQDGIMLINLLEIISSKKLGKYQKNPKMELQKLGNINLVLEFVKKEGLKLVNIGAKDIHDCVSPKLILGLIWTIILRYQIQCGGDSPKQALLDWVNKQIKPYAKHGVDPVTNFTKQWVDGRVICALADSISPGLMNNNVLNPGAPMQDWQEALDKSLEAFEIPPLVDADDCVNNPDEHSLMTYVSCFRDYLENKAKDADRYLREGPRAENSFATGRGVMQPGPCFRGRPLPFEIHGRNVNDQPVFGKWGPGYQVAVSGPDGAVPCTVTEIEDSLHNGLYTCAKAGPHKVSIIMDGKYGVPDTPIRGSEYHVDVKECTVAANSFADGPGLTNSFDDQPAKFTVHLNDQFGNPVVGEDLLVVSVNLEGRAPQVAPAAAAPAAAATVMVPSSKFCTSCGAKLSGAKFCEECGGKVEFVAAPAGGAAAAGAPRAAAQHSGSDDVPVQIKDNGDGTYGVVYSATVAGDYLIHVSVADELIRDMPSKMKCHKGISAPDTFATGRGVTDPGFINRKMPFVIHSHDRDGNPVPVGGGEFTVAVTGPKGVVPCTLTDNNDGTYSGCYEPVDLGQYVVDIRLQKNNMAQPIRDNPFRLTCKKGADPNKSYAEGEGLTDASDNRPAFFKIYAIDEDDKPVSGEWTEVQIVDAAGAPAGFPLDITDNGDGTYDVKYEADKCGDYKLTVLLGDTPIRDMPTDLHVHPGVDASNTEVVGAGVEGGQVNKDLPFTVIAKDKDGQPLKHGGDKFTVDIQGPAGPVPCELTDNKDGTYSGSYRPTTPGDYIVDLRVNDQTAPVGNSPYTCKVRPGGDPTKSYAKGKGWRYAYDNVPATFKVYVKDENGKPVSGENVTVVFLDKSSAEFKAKMDGLVAQVDEYMLKKKADMAAAAKAARAAAGEPVEPTEGDIPVTVTDNDDGTYTVKYVASTPGEYECSVQITNGHIKKSPKTIPVHWSCPNKPCSHTTKCLHTEIRTQRDEIYALKREIAALKGEAFEPDLTIDEGEASDDEECL